MNSSNEPSFNVIAALPVERWREFKVLRLRALLSDPAAFGQTHAGAFEYPDDLWQGRLQDVLDGSAWITFAEREQELVGMIGAFRSDEDITTNRATIWGVFVDPAAQGSGVGGTLLDTILGQLTHIGVAAVRLTVSVDQTAAVRLYKSRGFSEIDQVRAVLGDGLEHDELVMERGLGPRSAGSEAICRCPEPIHDRGLFATGHQTRLVEVLDLDAPRAQLDDRSTADHELENQSLPCLDTEHLVEDEIAD